MLAQVRVASRERRQERASLERWIELFVVCEIVCQLAQLTSSLSAFRLVWRTAPFAMSLALLALLPGRGRLHPACKAAGWALVIIVLSLFNPDRDTIMAAGAQIAMYVAILGPLFWVSRLSIDERRFRRVLLMMWGFQTLSASLGVLQGYYPGRFEPYVSSVIVAGGQLMDGLKYRNAFGVEVFRPMGLTDVPGGAATAGFFAVLFGVALFLSERRAWRKALFAASMLAGMACTYLCQVRATLVMVVASVLAFAALILWRKLRAPNVWHRIATRRQRGRLRLLPLAAAIVATVLIGFSMAVGIGGKSVLNRFNTIAPGNARETYRQSRGHFFQETIEDLLPEYPLGAGPGRWGMMNYYFGDKSDPDRPLWAEIQWTGWLFDGGVPLILAYMTALAIALFIAYKIVLDTRLAEIAVWGAMIFAYGLSVLVMTFDYAFFQSQGGMDFWLWNAMLFVVAWQAKQNSKPRARRAGQMADLHVAMET
jgi:hypothetical protein